jgi:hypothetical protein
VCDGYAPAVSEKGKQWQFHVFRSSASPLVLRNGPSMHGTESDIIARAFFTFRCTARHLSGLLSSGPLTDSLLRAAQRKGALRHAVLAIGAIYDAGTPSQRRWATQQHDAALRGLALMNQAPTPQSVGTILASWLLCASFEVSHEYHLRWDWIDQ